MARMFTSVLTSGILAAAGATLAWAQPGEAPSTEAPAEQQVQPPPPPPPEGGYGGYGGGYRRFRGRWGGDVPPQEWEPAAQFMEQHSPRRWQAYQSLPEDRRQGVRRMMYFRYRNLQQLRSDAPELYDLRMRQFVMEDDLWRLVDDLRVEPDSAQREQIIEQIRQRVQETTALWLQERDQRLALQEQNLKAMREDLATDQANLAEIVNERVQREVERARLPEGAMPLDPPPPGEGPGDHRGEGRGPRPPRDQGPPPGGPGGPPPPPR